MMALTLWQPWAWAVASGAKHIENRPWAPPKGALCEIIAIHAGKTYDPDGESFLRAHGVEVSAKESRVSMAVVGVMVVTGFVKLGQKTPHPALKDPMFFGPYGWTLDLVRMIRVPVPCKGALGLWRLPPDVAANVLQQLDEIEDAV